MSTQHRWILGGGLASGKSRVRELLASAGVDTVDADQVGHEVIEPDGPAFADVARRWPGVVTEAGIDRRALAAIVFGDPRELAELERITHPHIFDTIRARVEEIESPAVIEMPLVGERFGDGWRQLVVDCHDDVKIKRAVARGMDRGDALARVSVQPSRCQWLAAADIVIPNHGSLAELEDCVSKVVGVL